jgi:hypothetical protein
MSTASLPGPTSLGSSDPGLSYRGYDWLGPVSKSPEVSATPTIFALQYS